jgi:hypothetical protein
MVIYTGSTPWTAPLGVDKLLSPDRSPYELSEYAIRLPYFLLNFNEIPDENFHKTAWLPFKYV